MLTLRKDDHDPFACGGTDEPSSFDMVRLTQEYEYGKTGDELWITQRER